MARNSQRNMSIALQIDRVERHNDTTTFDRIQFDFTDQRGKHLTIDVRPDSIPYIIDRLLSLKDT
jgi:hypothetical protein